MFSAVTNGQQTPISLTPTLLMIISNRTPGYQRPKLLRYASHVTPSRSLALFCSPDLLSPTLGPLDLLAPLQKILSKHTQRILRPSDELSLPSALRELWETLTVP